MKTDELYGNLFKKTKYQKLQNSLHGYELKPLPSLLAKTNLMFHGIEVPSIFQGNSLLKDGDKALDDIESLNHKMDVLVMRRLVLWLPNMVI